MERLDYELKNHLDDLDERCARREFLEREWEAHGEQETRLKIIESLVNDDDYDYVGFWMKNPTMVPVMLAVYETYPWTRTKFTVGAWEQVRSVLLKAFAEHVEKFIAARIDDAREEWLDRMDRDGYGA